MFKHFRLIIFCSSNYGSNWLINIQKHVVHIIGCYLVAFSEFLILEMSPTIMLDFGSLIFCRIIQINSRNSQIVGWRKNMSLGNLIFPEIVHVEKVGKSVGRRFLEIRWINYWTAWRWKQIFSKHMHWSLSLETSKFGTFLKTWGL